ncbi:MAG TPA: DUF4392 domain-containing protein [Clostridia bacterium]|nr:DUF4392 domain-containing protein [Clostridia bacterium]
MNQVYFKQLEKIIRKNLEQRGLDGIELEGELYDAAASLQKGETILIVTGFVIRAAMVGETDGPVGAVSLAGALEQLGKRAVLITDKYSQNILDSSLKAKGLTCPVEIVASGNEGLFCGSLMEKYKPTHIVAIERPGRAADGCCYSMRGEDISDIVPDTDILLEEAKKQGAVTIAVGDGGNETGMGKISSYIIDSLHNGKKICAANAADYLILAGVSNWGGHALAAALSILTGTMLLHDTATEEKLLQSIIAAGAVDGCTKKSTMTVDGLSLEDNLGILNQLRYIVTIAIERP